MISPRQKSLLREMFRQPQRKWTMSRLHWLVYVATQRQQLSDFTIRVFRGKPEVKELEYDVSDLLNQNYLQETATDTEVYFTLNQDKKDEFLDSHAMAHEFLNNPHRVVSLADVERQVARELGWWDRLWRWFRTSGF